MSIGISAHKNDYRSGVRVGNWVEELFGEEAPVQEPLTLSAPPLAPPPQVKREVGEGAKGQPAVLLFSHGSSFGQDFSASMTGLHFSPPKERVFEKNGNWTERVHRTFYWGEKATDMSVPATDPNARTALMDAKRAQWKSEEKPCVPVPSDQFLSEKSKAGM